MRSVLLLAFFVRPRRGVGANRIEQLRKYLPEFGWNVTTLTARFDEPVNDEGIIQTPYVDATTTLKRLVGIGERSSHEVLGTTVAAHGERKTMRQRAIALGYAVTTYPDAEIGWFCTGRKQLAQVLATGRFDAVISSAPPFTGNLMLASLRPQIPWIADFRDLWGDTYSYRSRFRRRMDLGLERWTLRRATAATVVSEPMVPILQSHAPGLRVDAITNAFDAAEWESIPFGQESSCTFVYAGQLFRGRRSPEPLFRAVRRLLDDGAIDPREIRIDFYCGIEPGLRESIASYRLEDVVRLHGAIPRDDVMRAQRRADRLLVFLFEGRNSHVILPGKLFEYLGARRSILATGGGAESAVDGVFAETGAGIRCRDDATLQREVLQAVRERRAGSVRIVDLASSTRYEAHALAERFATLLDRVAARGGETR